MTLLAHIEGAVTGSRTAGDYVGSPMYGIIAEHGAAVILVTVLMIGAGVLHRRARTEGGRSAALQEGYRRLDQPRRVAAWMLLLAAAIHLGLVIGHEPSGYSVAYLIGAVAQAEIVRRMVTGRRYRTGAILVLLGSILTYTVLAFAGEPPDQVGMATKLVELTALILLTQPSVSRRFRRFLASGAMVTVTMLVGVGAWAGAMQAGEGGHHLGEAPPPGVLIPDLPDRDPTPAEIEAADHLYRETVAALDKYRDPAVAAADGFVTEGIWGTDFHADNPAYHDDGHILDPERPETLVYAAGPDGAVLLGAMYQVEGIGTPGPAVGGPLTVWHAHDHVCFSVFPPFLTGLVGPFGACPYGSITAPITNEMIHVWTIDRAPERFGDLPEDWIKDQVGLP